MKKLDYKKIVDHYRDMGVILTLKEGKLSYLSHKPLSQEQIAFLKEHKEGIIKLLATGTIEFPLTDIQSSYLLGRTESFDYGGISCQIYLEIEYPELCPSKVKKSWEYLINRHEMLRVKIRDDGYQEILEKSPDFDINCIDLRGKKNSLEELKKIRSEMENKEFCIGSWPYFDIAVSLQDNKAIMHMTVDFLIADWTSIWILIDEFERIYNCPEQELDTLDLTFREYIKLEQNMRGTKQYNEDKKYWINRIDSMPTGPILPILNKSNVQNGFERYFYQMDLNSWLELKKRALKYGCTPTAVVAAVYASVLDKWSQNDKFVLNLTLLNRLPLHENVNKIVGDFTSVNLLEINFSERDTFINKTKKIQAQMFEDLDHRTFSGVKVLREIKRVKNNESVFFPYVFTSSIGTITNENLKGKIGEYGISKTPQVFIDCQAMDNRFGLRINWDVRTGIFPVNMVEDMFGEFKRAMQNLLAFNDTWENEDIVSLPSNQSEIRNRINSTKKEFIEETLHGPILRQIQERKNKIAIIDQDGEYTYNELGKCAQKIACALETAGCKSADTVGIVVPKEFIQIACVLGTLMIGAIYVPIDEEQPINRMKSIIDSARIKYILSISDISVVSTEELGCKNVIFVDEIKKDKLENDDAVSIYNSSPSDLAYIIFTSGSTGIPKGVQITHMAANNTIKDINQRYDISEKDSVLALSKLNFDLSVYDIFGLLSVGGTIVFPNRKSYLDATHWSELLSKHAITVWNTVPSLMQMLLEGLEQKNEESISLRVVLLSGDWIPVLMPSNIWKYNKETRIIGLGGATEASIWSNYYECNKEDIYRESIPYGYPLSNQSYKILNSKMQECPDWVPGELYILGKGVAKGYINNYKLTESQFMINPLTQERMYRTGDYGYYEPDGKIIFMGRKDEQIKLNGHRIELGEIYSTIKKYPGISEAYVMLCGEDKKQIFAVVVMSDLADITGIQEYLRMNLPNYMIPTSIKVLDRLPLNINGKVDRNKIESLYKEQLVKQEYKFDNSDMNDELMKDMLKILEACLGINNLSPYTNVYDYGADSLILAQYIGKLKEYLEKIYSNMQFSFDGLLRQITNDPKIVNLYEFIQSCLNTNFSDDKMEEEKEITSRNIGKIIEYNNDDGNVTRVVFHTVLGNVSNLQHLIAHLVEQKAGRVVGVIIDDVDKYCNIESDKLIEVVARDYSESLMRKGISKVQLIGYSMGGLIALEVARLFMEQGVDICNLSLIDTVPINYQIKSDIILELLFITNFGITAEDIYAGINNQELKEAILAVFNEESNCLTDDDLENLKNIQKYANVYRCLEAISKIAQEKRFECYVNAIQRLREKSIPIDILRQYFKVYKKSVEASNFSPLPYFGDIQFLKPIEPINHMFVKSVDIDSVWNDICIGDFKINEINGNHMTSIEQDENAKEIAKILKKFIIVKD